MELRKNIKRILREETLSSILNILDSIPENAPLFIKRRINDIQNKFNYILKDIDFNEFEDVDDLFHHIVHELSEMIANDLDDYNSIYEYLDSFMYNPIHKIWKNRHKISKLRRLQEQKRKVLREETQIPIKLRRRISYVDDETLYKLSAIYRPDNICRYENGEELVDVIMEAVIESMYYKYFSDMDDNSGEWGEMYYFMVEYFRRKYSNEIIEYYNSNCQEIQEQLKQSMIISEDKKYDYIKKSFDEIFDNLELVKTYDDIHQYDWVNKNGEKIFERNDWGVFWIYGCDEYDNLKIIPKMMELSFYEFQKILIGYLNNKYKTQFGDEKPLKEIGTSVHCDDY